MSTERIDLSSLKHNQDLLDEDLGNVIKAFEKTLVIPKEKPSIQFTLCPIGLIHSGKTTVVRELSKRLNLILISSDNLRDILNSRGYNSKRMVEIIDRIVRKYLSLGYSTAADADCVSAKDVLLKREKEFGIKLVWIHINPPESFIINNLKTYEKKWLFKNYDEVLSAYQERKKLHTDLSAFKFVYVFDPSKNNFDSQIEESIKTINRTLNA